MTYRTFEHTADIGIEVEADTLPTLLEEAARAFRELTLDVAALDAAGSSVEFEVEADDLGALLVAWLEELLFLWDARGVMVVDLEATVDSGADGDGPYRARGRGRRTTAGPSADVQTDIKAITWHQLAVEPPGDAASAGRDAGQSAGWLARVIFDI